MQTATDFMKDSHGDRGHTFKPYAVCNRVWLEGTNIKSIRPKAKLDSKRYGPFTVAKVLSPLVYRLDIPSTWKRIHPVFHASLLSPFVETDAHGPNFLQPQPELSGTLAFSGSHLG